LSDAASAIIAQSRSCVKKQWDICPVPWLSPDGSCVRGQAERGSPGRDGHSVNLEDQLSRNYLRRITVTVRRGWLGMHLEGDDGDTDLTRALLRAFAKTLISAQGLEEVVLVHPERAAARNASTASTLARSRSPDSRRRCRPTHDDRRGHPDPRPIPTKAPPVPHRRRQHPLPSPAVGTNHRPTRAAEYISTSDSQGHAVVVQLTPPRTPPSTAANATGSGVLPVGHGPQILTYHPYIMHRHRYQYPLADAQPTMRSTARYRWV
jgi:hypothetical protein